ncbi:MAG TPA: hypothetical protein VFH66_05905 [Mycobacteriales bacterium]|nr:hypothetical protein [Mycobacteriales bacterium]
MAGARGSGGRRGERGGRGSRGEEGAAAALTGGGPSQLGIEGSMRARDVSRPRVADVAAAEDLVQVSYRPRPKSSAQPHSDGNGGSSPVSS